MFTAPACGRQAFGESEWGAPAGVPGSALGLEAEGLLHPQVSREVDPASSAQGPSLQQASHFHFRVSLFLKLSIGNRGRGAGASRMLGGACFCPSLFQKSELF